MINLELSEKLDENELESIAKRIRKYEDKNKYDNIWIFYFMKGTKENSGAWATTHFSPELKVEILGATKNEEQNSKNKIKNINGKIIGKWYEEQYTSSTFVIYNDNGKLYGKTFFKNGQEMTKNLISEKAKNGTKYFDPNDGNGEYYIILDNGDLGFYNKENKEYTKGIKLTD